MDKVILAKNIILDGDLGFTRPNDNQMVFGGTGSGKSMSIVLPTLCHMNNSSLIGTFAKKSIVDNAVSYFIELGYKTHVWNLANPKKGDKIPDPLSYVSSDDDVQELRDRFQMVILNTHAPRSSIRTGGRRRNRLLPVLFIMSL